MRLLFPTKILTTGLLTGLLVTALFAAPLLAQDCSPDDITLSTQSDVDDFQDNHGPCDRIVGGLTIDGEEIGNVDGLSGVVSMGNLRFLFTSELDNLTGLSSLTNIDGALFFTDSHALTSLEGLGNLTTIGGILRISFMGALTDLDSLSSLDSVGSITLEYNTALSNVDGLSSIQSVAGSVHLESNTVLLNFDGFAELTTVGGSFRLFDQQKLTHIEGLSALISVGEDFRLEFNNLLTNCGSLAPLLDNKDHGDPGPGPGSGGVPDVGGAVTIGENLPGCNTIDEIINPIFSDSFDLPGNTITVVDDSENTGAFTSIAIGADGYPVISYRDGNDGSLKVTKCHDLACSGGNETITVVDGPSAGVSYSSIAVGSDGLPVIAYATNRSLKVVKCNDEFCAGGGETSTTVDHSDIGLGYHVSMVHGTDGFPVMSYHDDDADQLRVAKCNDPACTGEDEIITIVDSETFSGSYTSIAIGDDDFPVISYHNGSGDLKVAKCNDTACAGGDELISVVDAPDGENVGQHTSIAVGADGSPIISYYNQTAGYLMVAKCNDTACTGGDELISLVDDSDKLTGIFASIAIPSDDLPVISYSAQTFFTHVFLKTAKCNDPACTGGDEIVRIVDEQPNKVVGAYTSIAIGSDGLPVVSYRDHNAETLKVLKCGTASCGRP